MKRTNFFSKTTMLALTVGMSIFVFAGCGSSTAQTSSSGTTSTTQSTAQSNNKPNAQQRAQRIKDSIQPLVSDKTITQAQADKIVAAFTTNMHKPGSAGTVQKNNQQGNSQQGNNQNDGKRRQRNSPLAKLVSDGTITQAQADAVMKNIGANFQHRDKGQGTNNNGQTSTQQ
jgi:hypothetical protein